MLTILCNDPVLQYRDFSREFILTTDVALGAVLSRGTFGSERPVTYASRTLNGTERHYSSIEKDTLAIVWTCTYFRSYLSGKPFQILADCRPLV